MSADVLLERDADGIAILTFNRSHVRNALTLDAMRQFHGLIESLADDPSLRVLIVTGAGRDAFCSGGDLIDLQSRPTEADAREFITIMGDALAIMERLPAPVIAAVHGYALGGGSEIAIACDLRIVDEAAQMGFVQIRMALTPGWGAGQRLMRTVGYSRALAILLEGRPMGADELLAFGLAHHVAPRAQALDEALTLARRIAKHPPTVVASIKRVLWAGLTQPYADALQTERDVFPALWAAEDHLRAVEMFLNRR